MLGQTQILTMVPAEHDELLQITSDFKFSNFICYSNLENVRELKKEMVEYTYDIGRNFVRGVSKGRTAVRSVQMKLYL